MFFQSGDAGLQVVIILSDDSDMFAAGGLLDVGLKSTSSCCCAEGEVGWC